MDRRQFSLAASVLAFAPLTADAAAPPLARFVDGPRRTPDNKVRDPFRHPAASLSFWGLAPGTTVVEIEPSGGYWTEILAPYLAASGGKYVAAVRGEPSAFIARYADRALWGDIGVVPLGSGPLVSPGTADMVLTARNFHDWMWRPGLVA
ncbi:MAG TPA: methyltransferase, partial [Caulobacteraceae bacterium]